jgi:hypothetical protein
MLVPDRAHEALRDLARGPELAKADLLRARHRPLKSLLRQGGTRRPESRLGARIGGVGLGATL